MLVVERMQQKSGSSRKLKRVSFHTVYSDKSSQSRLA